MSHPARHRKKQQFIARTSSTASWPWICCLLTGQVKRYQFRADHGTNVQSCGHGAGDLEGILAWLVGITSDRPTRTCAMEALSTKESEHLSWCQYVIRALRSPASGRSREQANRREVRMRARVLGQGDRCLRSSPHRSEEQFHPGQRVLVYDRWRSPSQTFEGSACFKKPEFLERRTSEDTG